MTIELRQRRRRRNATGASVILVAVCAILLIAAIWCAFHFSMLEGGSTEVRNVVDAATLNVSKQAVFIKVPPGPSYHELADSSGGIGLANINRVWGKAYLINANMQSMQALGQVGPNASGNAEESYQAAQQVNDMLVGALMNKEQLDQYFNQVANSRMARMINNTVATNPKKKWAVAMVNRGYESNLQMYPQQVPPSVPQPSNVNISGSTYVAGYNPFQSNNNTFTFTSFRLGEMPHLLGDQLFQQNRGDLNPVPGAKNPVPNAWMEAGDSAVDANNGLEADACSVANPMRTYTMAIPYGYVIISFTNNSKWYFDNKLLTQTPYQCQPDQTFWEIKQLPLPPSPCGGKLNGYANLGNEYSAPTLWGVFCGLPGDHTQALKGALQRLQEVQPSLTMNSLVGVMMNTPFQPGVPAYVLYPVYHTPDLTDPKIVGSSINNIQAPWLQLNPSDGTAQPVMQEGTEQDQPNRNWENIIGGKYPSGQHNTTCSGTISWSPSTGYQQNLGAITVSRLTQCYFTDYPP